MCVWGGGNEKHGHQSDTHATKRGLRTARQNVCSGRWYRAVTVADECARFLPGCVRVSVRVRVRVRVRVQSRIVSCSRLQTQEQQARNKHRCTDATVDRVCARTTSI